MAGGKTKPSGDAKFVMGRLQTEWDILQNFMVEQSVVAVEPLDFTWGEEALPYKYRYTFTKPTLGRPSGKFQLKGFPLAHFPIKDTVSFDIYRQTDSWLSNLWWWWYDPGTPTYGLQWDQPPPYGETYPFGWDGTGTPTVLDNWATVEMTWDFDSGLAMGYYDGQLITTVNITGISSLTGWAFSLAHDEGAGSGPDVAWLDNFEIFATTGPTLLVEPDPLQAGQYALLTVVNANPTTTTYVAYSLVGPGSTYIAPLQVTLGIMNPVQAAGSAQTDTYGTADWTVYVPPFAAGRSVWLQSAQFQLVTNVVATSVQ